MNTKQLKEEIQKIIDELNSINEKLDEEPAEGEEKDPEEERMYIAQLEKRSKELILRKKELEEKLKIEERKNQMKEVISGAGKNPTPVQERNMGNIEVRNTTAYINAYANYIKTGDNSECRALLSENADNGDIPVSDVVEGYINTAWDKLDILSRVHRVSLKGNVKIGFELSATDAEVHKEGTEAPTEEVLKLGIVKLTPGTIKKWITISDEALELNGVAFLEYVYSEIAYKIFKKAEEIVIDKILKAPDVATATTPSVGKVTITGVVGDIYSLQTKLSDEAATPVLIMDRATYAARKTMAAGANYAIDVFDGMEVLFNEKCAGKIILADLEGITANFVNGNEITFKYDDLSLAEKDLVKIVGRLPIAIEITACGRIVVGATA